MKNLYLTTVTLRKNALSILFYTELAQPMGFVPNALVQFLPEDSGAKFRLCNENIASYSRLFEDTTAQGGVLVHAKMFKHRDYPCLGVSGEVVCHTGLKHGDNLLARFEYGLIHMRKLPPGQLKVVTSRLFGKWLVELGFEHESVVLVDSVPGLITCQLQENGMERAAELVKHAYANGLNLIQVQRIPDSRQVVMSQFEIPPSRFIKAGFAPDDVCIASYEYGCIQLRKLDFAALGFDVSTSSSSYPGLRL